MIFFDWCINVYKEQCDNFSPQQDFVETIEKDFSFPKHHTSHYDIHNYLNMRQNGDASYFDGYEIETVFNFIWEQYEKYLYSAEMVGWYL